MTETRIIKFGDQDWKVTPFHCVVGPISLGVWQDQVCPAWLSQLKPSTVGRLVKRGPFETYPTEWQGVVARWRQEEPDRWILHYDNNPLIVNEYQWNEVTLACIDEGRLVLTNFEDLPGVDVAKKIYFPGEFWLNYAEGGAERALREGRPRGTE